MITRRKRPYAIPVGLRMMNLSRNRITTYIPSATQFAPPRPKAPALIARQVSPHPLIPVNDTEEQLSIDQQNPQDNELDSSASRAGIPADLLRILQLHQEVESTREVEVENDIPLQLVDLADALSLREKEAQPTSPTQVPRYRPARIQEVTPSQSAASKVANTKSVNDTVSDHEHDAPEDQSKYASEKVDPWSLTTNLKEPEHLPLRTSAEAQPLKIQPQNITENIPALASEDTTSFEAVSEVGVSDPKEPPSPSVFPVGTHVGQVSVTLQQSVQAPVANKVDDHVQVRSIESVESPRALSADLKPLVDFSHTGESSPIQLSPYNTSNDKEILQASPPNLSQAINAERDSNDLHVSLNKPVNTSELEEQLAEPAIHINEVIDNTPTVLNSAENLNTIADSTGVDLTSSLPIESSTSKAAQSVKSEIADKLSASLERRESAPEETTQQITPDAELLKLLDLPPETPVIGRTQTTARSTSEPLSSVQSSTSTVQRLPKIGGSSLESLSESAVSQTTQRLENVGAQIIDELTQPAKNNVNVEKLARRVYELIKDRLHREFERRFDNPGL